MGFECMTGPGGRAWWKSVVAKEHTELGTDLSNGQTDGVNGIKRDTSPIRT